MGVKANEKRLVSRPRYAMCCLSVSLNVGNSRKLAMAFATLGNTNMFKSGLTAVIVAFVLAPATAFGQVTITDMQDFNVGSLLPANAPPGPLSMIRAINSTGGNVYINTYNDNGVIRVNSIGATVISNANSVAQNYTVPTNNGTGQMLAVFALQGTVDPLDSNFVNFTSGVFQVRNDPADSGFLGNDPNTWAGDSLASFSLKPREPLQSGALYGLNDAQSPPNAQALPLPPFTTTPADLVNQGELVNDSTIDTTLLFRALDPNGTEIDLLSNSQLAALGLVGDEALIINADQQFIDPVNNTIDTDLLDAEFLALLGETFVNGSLGGDYNPINAAGADSVSSIIGVKAIPGLQLAIPEPTTVAMWTMLGIGLAAGAWLRKRRNG